MEIQVSWLFAAAAVAYVLYGVIRHGGYKAWIFGGKIVRTVGELELDEKALTRTRARVHILRDPSSAELIVLELSSGGPFGGSMAPYRLSRDQAASLAHMLQAAVQL